MISVVVAHDRVGRLLLREVVQFLDVSDPGLEIRRGLGVIDHSTYPITGDREVGNRGNVCKAEPISWISTNPSGVAQDCTATRPAQRHRPKLAGL